MALITAWSVLTSARKSALQETKVPELLAFLESPSEDKVRVGGARALLRSVSAQLLRTAFIICFASCPISMLSRATSALEGPHSSAIMLPASGRLANHAPVNCS